VSLIDERSSRSELERLKLFGAVRKDVIGSAQQVADRPVRSLVLRVARGVAGTKSKAQLHRNNLIINWFLVNVDEYDIVLM
jgi:hypothetical protein